MNARCGKSEHDWWHLLQDFLQTWECWKENWWAWEANSGDGEEDH